MPEDIQWPEFVKLQPKAAMDYLRKKGHKTSFDYFDIQREEHAINFTVAKAMSQEILVDIRSALDSALADGTTFETFKKNLAATLQEKGWWGKKEMLNPKTGEMELVQLGSPRRLKIIYDTNLRTAYAAGRWEAVERTKKLRPYLRYISVMDGRERPEHHAWHNTVLPVDDPWWKDHYPPNGWRCRCSVQQLSERDVNRLNLKVADNAPARKDVLHIDKRTGESIAVPKGIDPSFAYNVGMARMKAMTPPPLDQKLVTPFLGDPLQVPPPAARKVPKDRLLPAGLSDEDYVRSFMKEFGGDIGKPVIFKDVTGEPLIISEDLFKTRDGRWKASKRGRAQYLLLLADAIKDPDEIMWSWTKDRTGKPQLYRSYTSRHLDEKQVPGFTLFSVSKLGWSGLTSFTADDFKYLDRQRVGSIAYRRPDKPDKK